MREIYYTRDKLDEVLDESIRQVIMNEGSSVEQKLYIQNIMILSLLRQVSDDIKEIKEILKAKDE